jgi:hypothetical protein
MNEIYLFIYTHRFSMEFINLKSFTRKYGGAETKFSFFSAKVHPKWQIGSVTTFWVHEDGDLVLGVAVIIEKVLRAKINYQN